MARLTDVVPDGRSFNLLDGIVRARFRGFGAGKAPWPIEPGRPFEDVLDLWATGDKVIIGNTASRRRLLNT